MSILRAAAAAAARRASTAAAARRASTAASADRAAATSLPRSTGMLASRSPRSGTSLPMLSSRRLSSTPPNGLNENEIYIYNLMVAVHADAKKQAQVLRDSLATHKASMDGNSLLIASNASVAKRQLITTATTTVLALGGLILAGFCGVLQFAQTAQRTAEAEVQLAMAGGEATKAAKEATKAAKEARDAAQAATASVDTLNKSA